MEPERWHRVEELYHSSLRVARDQRAAFLKDACHGDTKLHEEVESLLAYETSAKEFMETPAFEVAAKQMAGDEAEEAQFDPLPISATLQRFASSKASRNCPFLLLRTNVVVIERAITISSRRRS